ncbi:MAG: hypothetical protein LBS44_05755 [Deltaproteobacteria bacterium]|jgi:hypothetical protein|nr:hypothetical protein [Deltaproteobacteria bacterium]
MRARFTSHSKTRKIKPRIPAYLLKRGDYYYYRQVLPTQYKQRLGNEVCLSLRTSLRADAVKLSRYLTSCLQELLEIPDMDFTHLRRSLYLRLQLRLDMDSSDDSPRIPSKIYEGIKEKHPEYNWLEFSTKGHPQTTGHNFTLHSPRLYEKTSDFSKEDYLQTFVESDEEGSGDSYFYLTVSIHNLPNNILPSSLLPDGLWDFKTLDQFWNILAK